MSKRCPDCGFMNEDSRIYCSSCGELLDPELRLIQSLERQKSAPSKAQPARREAAPEPPASRKTGSGWPGSRRAVLCPGSFWA